MFILVTVHIKVVWEKTEMFLLMSVLGGTNCGNHFCNMGELQPK